MSTPLTFREQAFIEVQEIVNRAPPVQGAKEEFILGAQAALVQLYQSGGWSEDVFKESMTRLWKESKTTEH